MTVDFPRLEVLRQFVAEVTNANPFYAQKWADLESHPLPSSAADFAARFPFTTKSELVRDQAAHPPYGTDLSLPLVQYVRCHQTSGTTGAPLRWLDTATDWSALTEDWVTVFRASGMTAEDRVFVAFSFGPFLGFWLAFEAAQRLGCLCFPGGGMSSALRARVLLENQCTVLCGTPTYLLHLAAAARNEGLDLSRSHVRLLVVAGETGGSLPTTRARLSEAWNGARVFDHHGMTEVGPVTYEHPQHPGTLVILEKSFWAEVIERGGTASVPDGELGELVLTTLRRPGSPLVRYRTGDVVRARRITSSGTLETGETALVLEGGILGRVDDMIVIRGVNLYPAAIDDLIGGFPDIVEYRVTHDLRADLPALTVEIEAPTTTPEIVAAKLRQSLGLRIDVQRVEPGSLPRSENKARRWQRIGPSPLG